MQKSGKFFWEILPKTIVPLDSAVVFTLYATYYTALHAFRQYVFYPRNPNATINISTLSFRDDGGLI